jgi:hypothetical protein
MITKLSQTDYVSKTNSYTLKKDATLLSKIEGEWSKFLRFDDDTMWDMNDMKYYDLTRMSFTLPSDSTVREDLVLLKYGREDEAEEFKTILEEVQRRDRKLRSSNNKESSHH